MSPLAETIVRKLQAAPRQFSELVDAHLVSPRLDFLRAWGEVRSANILRRDEDGRYFIGMDSRDALGRSRRAGKHNIFSRAYPGPIIQTALGNTNAEHAIWPMNSPF
jgi:hypothetical protein